jgi:hypothetical protein
MREFQAGVSTFWEGTQDAVAYRESAVNGYQAAEAAIARGVAPTDPEGIAIGRTWLDASARAMGREADEGFLHWLQDQYAAPGGARTRLQELLAVLKGETPAVEQSRAWHWLIDAARAAAQNRH